MRLENNAKLSHPVGQGCGERKGLSTFVRHTASVLTIPRLNQNIQTKFNAGKHSRNLAGLALNLMRKGYIEKDAAGELPQIVANGIQKWVLDCAGNLKYFDFSIELTPELDQFSDEMMDEDFAEMKGSINDIAGEAPMFLLIEPGELATMTIGNKLQAIEEKTAGLGSTAYYWLATIGAKNLDVYTPWRGSDLAQQVWWYGEDNQDDFEEILKSYYDDESLEDTEAIGPANWDASFPAWVTNLNKALSESELQLIAQAEPGSLESEVARILLDMIENQDASTPCMQDVGMNPVYNGLYLHWEENDMSHRLMDDWFQMANENGGEGYTETLSLSPIPSKPFQFRQWMAKMEKGFIQLKNIERLIELIGTRTN